MNVARLCFVTADTFIIDVISFKSILNAFYIIIWCLNIF